MLETLCIENLLTIDQVELSFAKGFTALTGETGAGKSLLFDALQLLGGAKAGALLLRPGAKKAQISAVFQLMMCLLPKSGSNLKILRMIYVS